MNPYRVSRQILPLLIVSMALAEDKPDLSNPLQRSSYAIGVDIGRSVKRQPIDFDAKAIAAGLIDGYSGGTLALTDSELKEVLAKLQDEFRTKAAAKQQQALAENQKKGEQFLVDNAKKEGVKTTASGLQYQVIKSGTGKTPGKKDTVKVHYHGTLVDGTVFDSSVDRGEPISFPVDGVIPGWTEALQLMKEGDKWKIFIPSSLAYGERGAGDKIGPNSALVFEVELLAVEGASK
jgi:FKBP-type peptidyl-prolyl cis-trans isomerase FklB